MLEEELKEIRLNNTEELKEIRLNEHW